MHVWDGDKAITLSCIWEHIQMSADEQLSD